MELNTISNTGSWGNSANRLNENFSKVNTEVEKLKNATTKNKGYFKTDALLKQTHQTAYYGDIAYVGTSYPYHIWTWNGTNWEDSQSTGGSETVNLGNYYTREDIDTQQQQQNDSLAAITEKQTSQENKIIEVEKSLENLEVAGVDVASADKLGGIKAETKTDAETAEAKIDPETGKLYVPAGGNNPDNEDLFLEKDENTQKEVMKFADKEYNADRFSGLGRVYLRINISASKNVLTQDMMSKENTRYIIQYDYDLDGATINIPEGCVLDFQGGSFSNGTITGNNSVILSSPVHIFTSIVLDGTYNVFYIYPEWFKTMVETDWSNAIQSCINIATVSQLLNNINIVFQSAKIYEIGKPILIDKIRINFVGNNCILRKKTSDVGDGTFTEGGNNISLAVNCFFYTNRNMYFINIADFNLQVTDESLKNNVTGFFFPYINRSKISNIKTSYLYDGINTIDSWQNIFENIVFDYTSNCGFKIMGGTSTHINKCWVTHAEYAYNIKSLYYSTLTCCASDYSKTSYYIDGCCITLNGCGCEITDNSYAILTNAARVIFNNFFFIGDNNTDKEVFAFIGESYVEFNKADIRNTAKLLKNLESEVIFNRCKVANWEIGYNSGVLIRYEKNKKLGFREEFGNNWSVLNYYDSCFSTDKRPILTAYDYGVEIYDINLRKKILWTGESWVNVDGTKLNI